MLVKCKTNNKLYAMKGISKSLIENYDMIQSVKEEKRVLLNAAHPFLICAHCCFQSICRIFFVLDYAPDGTLRQIIK